MEPRGKVCAHATYWDGSCRVPEGDRYWIWKLALQDLKKKCVVSMCV